MKTTPNPKRSLAKTPLPEVCLLPSGRVRAARCLASGGLSHSGSGMRIPATEMFTPSKYLPKNRSS